MNLPRINPGDGIGLVAPAGAVREEAVAAGIKILEDKGFLVKTGTHLFGHYRNFSGTIVERAADIESFLADPSVKAIYAARGGMGSLQLLPLLNYEAWKTSEKLLIGFSDITAMQWALWHKASLPSLSGMTLGWQLHSTNPFVELSFKILSGEKKSISDDDLNSKELVVHQQGEAQGLLLGGTLSIMNSLLGTPYFPEVPQAILFIEDINEPPYKIERMLIQLQLAGVLNKIHGLILGQFGENVKSAELWSNIKYLFPANIPVVSNFPYGHFQDSCCLPLGVSATLQADPFKLEW